MCHWVGGAWGTSREAEPPRAVCPDWSARAGSPLERHPDSWTFLPGALPATESCEFSRDTICFRILSFPKGCPGEIGGSGETKEEAAAVESSGIRMGSRPVMAAEEGHVPRGQIERLGIEPSSCCIRGCEGKEGVKAHPKVSF